MEIKKISKGDMKVHESLIGKTGEGRGYNSLKEALQGLVRSGSAGHEPEMMKTNCSCSSKSEQWNFDSHLGCWYAVRECENCSYYWEGPDYSKTNISIQPQTGDITAVIGNDVPCEGSLTERSGRYSIYSYDEVGNYGSPVKFDEIEDIFNFCELNKYSHKEIRVVDPRDDTTVIQVIDGTYVPPKLGLALHQFTN